MAEQPIIIKKVKKGGHGGHHGGAWKIAYADFVTAMMAFFLLMWLLGSTDEATKKGISEYFQNPFGVAMSGSGVGDRANIIKAGGSDLASKDVGQVHMGEDKPPPPAPPSPEDIEKLAEEQEKQKLEKLQEKIESMLDANAKLAEYKDQIKLETTPEGLKIQIIDAQNRPMFKLASSGIETYAQAILRELAPVINELPNKVTINGHTDALPFPSNRSGYSNWELSSDRANVARRELTQGGWARRRYCGWWGWHRVFPTTCKTRPTR
ncbi:flagellar motor protein MotB [Methylomonas sp. CM2]|uniref:flagellar motor protein MotB n=1 Tax=Methylomonas sp. CM2 TaxID=3417647 RepID=UPI003CFBA804